MDVHPRLKDLFSTLGYSLSHDEQVRAMGRLAFVVVAVIAVGFGGGLIAQSITPSSERYVDRQPGSECIYDAASAEAGALAAQPESSQAYSSTLIVMAPPGAPIYAQWFIRNTSTCAWDAAVQFRSIDTQQVTVMTDTLSVPPFQIPNNTLPTISPGGTLAPVVQMIAPSSPGSYTTKWRLFAPDGIHWFGPEFTFTINVATGIEGVVPASRNLHIDWWLVIPAMIGILIALIRAGAFVTKMYSLKSLWRGIAFAVDTTLGLALNRQSITVRHGEYEGKPTDDHEVLLKVGGPGVLSIMDNTAVLTERGARYSRVLGPEDHTLMPFERIRAIYDLRTQSFDSVETSVTKDGIPVRAKVGAMFRFMKRLPDEPPSSPQHPRFLSVLRHYWRRTPYGSVLEPPVSPEALRMACYEVPRPPNPTTWYQAAFGAAKGEVGEELSRRTLDEIFAPDDPTRSPRREIAEKLDSAGRAALAPRGIELVDSSFGNLQLPRAVTAQRTTMWQAGWEKEATISRATSEADSLLQIQTVYAEAQADIIKAIAQAARMMDKNNHLSQPVMRALAHVVERAVQREAVLPLLSADTRKEVEESVKQLRQSVPPSGS
jgi:regulator of protease activity HflC (stomatin/prohibitin superfamily)